jgi:hypothetical protein
VDERDGSREGQLDGVSGPPAPRGDLELLASVKVACEDGVFRPRGFGNVLELGCDALVLEASGEQEEGDELTVGVVFPGVVRDRKCVAFLECVVEQVRDPVRLHYGLGIRRIDDTARAQLIEFLSLADSDTPTCPEEGR